MSIPVQFDVLDIIQRSWASVKENGGPLIGGTVLVILISMAANSIPGAGLVIQGPLQFGLYTVALAAARGKAVRFEDLFAGFQRFVPAFLAGLLILIISGVGFIFCVIPGLIATVLYTPTYLYMMDEGLDFWPAMERSRNAVWENFLPWCLLILGLFGLNLLGALACCVGIFVTGPMSLVAICIAYDQQRGAAGKATPSMAV